LPITAHLGDCIKNVIAEMTYMRIEMHLKDAIGTEQNVTL